MYYSAEYSVTKRGTVKRRTLNKNNTANNSQTGDMFKIHSFDIIWMNANDSQTAKFFKRIQPKIDQLRSKGCAFQKNTAVKVKQALTQKTTSLFDEQMVYIKAEFMAR